MLSKILIVAKRDYIESVKTKAFIFGLVVAPILFGSGFIAIALTQSRPDIAERRIAIVDRTGISAAAVIDTVRAKNDLDLYDKATGKQTMPRYALQTIPPDEANLEAQRLALSSRVNPHDLDAFIEIGSKAVHPDSAGDKNPDNGVAWYSNDTGIGGEKSWITPAINDGIRRVRMAQAGVDPARFEDLLGRVNVQSMNLVSRDEKTGLIRAAGKRAEHENVVPLVLVMMLFMLVMTTAAPMLNGIAEDKMQRVHEMLLASVTPFELIAGKVLGALGRSVTSAAVYIAGTLLLLNAMALMGLVHLALLPWFLVYIVAEMTMLSAMAAALGAACGSPQDAQSLGMLLFTPVIIPMMMTVVVLQKPNGTMATIMSLFPPFTPMMMLLRQALPGGIPWWQPWAGLVGMTVGVIAISWIAARIFRVAILLQGKPPSLAELAKWAIRG